MDWKNLIQNNTDWLINSNTYTKYNTLIELLEKPINNIDVIEAKRELLHDDLIINLLEDTANWFDKIPIRHNDATLSHYKLRMLADFGLKNTDANIPEIIITLKAHRKKEMFAIRQEIPQTNISKKEEWFALPCNSPLLTYTLLKLGDSSFEVQHTIDQLKRHWISTEGWFCNLMFVSNQFKKHRIACPMAGIMALEVFSMDDSLKSSGLAKNAFKTLEFHHNFGKSLYFFGRSKRFFTFKYPFVWYNALYVADVVTRFPMFKKEPLVKELIKWIEDSFDTDGRIKPSSIFKPYSDWDFADKKQASPWITFLAYRILKRYYEEC